MDRNRQQSEAKEIIHWIQRGYGRRCRVRDSRQRAEKVKKMGVRWRGGRGEKKGSLHKEQKGGQRQKDEYGFRKTE